MKIEELKVGDILYRLRVGFSVTTNEIVPEEFKEVVDTVVVEKVNKKTFKITGTNDKFREESLELYRKYNQEEIIVRFERLLVNNFAKNYFNKNAGYTCYDSVFTKYLKSVTHEKKEELKKRVENLINLQFEKMKHEEIIKSFERIDKQK